MKTPSTLLLLTLGALAVGCAKDSASSSAPGAPYRDEVYEESYDDGAYGGEGYGNVYEASKSDAMEMDDMEPPAEPSPVSTTAVLSMDSRRERKRIFGKRKQANKGTAAPEPASENGPQRADASASAGDATPADERPPQVDEARHIVYTAGMRIAVFNLEDAMATAEGLPDRYGGYIQSMSDQSIVLRLPSKSLREVMNSLGGYGNVENRWMRSQDVTAEFTDISSRIKALEETHAQLLGLLDKARTVEEALKVRQALDGISSELEVLKGRMRQLQNMTTYSTLTLEFYERGPHNPTPSSNDPFPWVDGLGVEDTEWK